MEGENYNKFDRFFFNRRFWGLKKGLEREKGQEGGREEKADKENIFLVCGKTAEKTNKEQCIIKIIILHHRRYLTNRLPVSYR